MLKTINLNKLYSPQISKGIITGCEIKPELPVSDGQLAVNDVSFELKKGEIMAILGENGSGKSTLLKMLAGLIEPTHGKILLDNTQILGPSTKLVAGHENIKLIHQSYNLQPNISIEENIKYSLRFYTNDYKIQRTSYLIDICHLENVKHKLPRQTSGGEQQRTAIACALATPTDVLLLDEPFSNLDVFNSEILKKQMVAITKKEKIHTIFVTHDAEDALSVSQRLIVIKQGNIIQNDSPKTVYQYPINDYVAQITGLCMILKQKDANTYFGHHFEQKIVFLRPEQLKISDTGLAVVVLRTSFRGGHYLVEAKVENAAIKVTFYSQNFIEINQKINLTYYK